VVAHNKAGKASGENGSNAGEKHAGKGANNGLFAGLPS
jgi:hypothetical protein